MEPTEKLPHIYELDGQWPSDTWFRRAMALKLQREAAEIIERCNESELIEALNHAKLPKVQP